MSPIKNYAFASGGILWKILDRPDFESKSLAYQIRLVSGMALLCWVPLAALSLYKLGWDQFYLLFVRDVATHVRFLLVLPILLFSRSIVNRSFNKTIAFFYQTKIVDTANREEFEHVMETVGKWKNSKIIDFFLIFLVYFAFFVQTKSRVNNSSTYAPWYMADKQVIAAGWWYLVFSLPLLQLLLYRWLYTTILWIIFLRKISRIDLHLSALHPDGAGGLGFLQYAQLSFFPVALAFSALTAGTTNNLIMFSGISIVDYKVAIGSVLVFVLLLFILPLMLLLPMLAKVKRNYFMQYSLEAWPIARKFEEQLKAYHKEEDENPDTSWHVDLIGSFEKVQDMKILLVDKTILLSFTVAVVVPFLPVIAQQIPLKDLFLNLIGKVLG